MNVENKENEDEEKNFEKRIAQVFEVLGKVFILNEERIEKIKQQLPIFKV